MGRALLGKEQTSLVEKIVVNPLENARAELEFVLRNLSTPLRNGEVGNCLSVPRMGLGGLEPPTSRLSGVYSNQLSYRPHVAHLQELQQNVKRKCNSRASVGVFLGGGRWLDNAAGKYFVECVEGRDFVALG